MAWLILILIIPFAGFHHLPVPGRDTTWERRGWPANARPRKRSELRPNGCPSLPVSGPVYLDSMAALSRNLGSMPLQEGDLIELVPGYSDAIQAG